MTGGKLTRTELKQKAQETIAYMVSTAFTYANESDMCGEEIPAEQWDEFWSVLEHQADRAARLMGYEKHWKS